MECTVPVAVHLAIEHADVGSLERAVTDALARVGQALWAELLGRLDEALARPATCPACGDRLVANGRAPRRLVTLAGEVELRRRRYRCLGCGTRSCRSTPPWASSPAPRTPSASASGASGW